MKAEITWNSYDRHGMGATEARIVYPDGSILDVRDDGRRLGGIKARLTPRRSVCPGYFQIVGASNLYEIATAAATHADGEHAVEALVAAMRLQDWPPRELARDRQRLDIEVSRRRRAAWEASR